MNTTRRNFLRFAGLAAGAIGVSGQAALSASPAFAAPSVFPPSSGNIFYGASEAGTPSLAKYSGKNLGIDRAYYQASSWQSMVSYAAGAASRGSVPLVSIKAPADWRTMAGGSQDTWIKNIVNGLAAITGPVCWSIHHEPENDVNGTSMTAATFKAMCGRVAGLHPAPSQSGVWFGPTLMGGKYNQISTPNTSVRQYLKDWVHPACHAGFFDGYNHWTPGGLAKWRTVPDTFDHMVNGYRDKRTGVTYQGYKQLLPGKPIVIAEYGVRYDSTGTYDAVAWMADAYTYATSQGLAGMSFFSSNQNVNDGGTAWTLDGARRDEFKKLLLRTSSVLTK